MGRPWCLCLCSSGMCSVLLCRPSSDLLLQSAWLRNASIRDNILFDLPYIEERYQKTLEVCALLSDLKILEDGDMSEIGERGVNLSGGQKARGMIFPMVQENSSLRLACQFRWRVRSTPVLLFCSSMMFSPLVSLASLQRE